MMIYIQQALPCAQAAMIKPGSVLHADKVQMLISAAYGTVQSSCADSGKRSSILDLKQTRPVHQL